MEITLAERIEKGTASPLLIRAGILQDDGSVSYQPNINLDILATGGSVASATGVTADDGFFSTEVTMGASSTQLNVFVTATNGDETIVAAASALPFESGNASVVLTSATFFVSASANARAGANTDGDGNRADAAFPPSTSFSGTVSAAAAASDDEGSATGSSSASLSAQAIMISADRMTGVTISGSTFSTTSANGGFNYNANAFSGGSCRYLFDVVDGPILVTLSTRAEGNSGATLAGGVTIRDNGQAVLPRGSYQLNVGVSPANPEGSGPTFTASIEVTLTFSRPPGMQAVRR